jgi:hypothetical protein
MRMEISIEESLQGHAALFDLNNGPVQEFVLRLENTGSVNCLARPRLDIYTSGEGDLTDLAYTAWGSEEALMAGASREWRLYSALPQGSYSAVLRTHYCNEIFKLGTLNFSALGLDPDKSLTIDVLTVGENAMDLSVSGLDGKVVVIPEDYPSGWIFEAAALEEEGHGQAWLGFEPVRVDGTSVMLRAISLDGLSYGERRVSLSLRKEQASSDLIYAIFILPVVFFLLYLSRNKIKIWRK